MVQRDSLTGFTASEWTEIRMWFSLSSIVLTSMAFLRWVGFLDYFRLFFFSSPFWLTIIIAPCQTDRSRCKLLVYSLVVFLASWFCVHSYPSQCRHAWGTMMVSDTTFFHNATAEADAILLEKDSYFEYGGVSKADRLIYWPKMPKNSTNYVDDPRTSERNDVTEALKIIKGDEDVTQDDKRVKKWIEAWSGGLSEDILLLRAFCNLHQADPDVPHVYPLRVLGVLPNQANWTAPCPYWSCLMTEARPKGKLIFFTTLGAAGALNYLHYRFDCESFRFATWWLGAGQPRLFWWWFWAALCPLALVMLIKTTFDDELAVVISNLFHGIFDPFWSYAFDTVDADGQPVDANAHKFQIVLLFAGIIAAWVYRVRIRHELGLDDHWFLPMVLARDEAEHVMEFQVCVWRVDVISEPGPQAVSSPVKRQASDGEEDADFEGGSPDMDFSSSTRSVGSRSLMLCGSPGGQRSRRGGWGIGKLPFPTFGRNKDGSRLTAPDGRVPTLSVHFYWGMDEIQATRKVKPTSDQWWGGDPIYFQENFKLRLEYRPNVQLRVEIRDATATLGSVSLGSLYFDEASLERSFGRSKKANPQVRRHSVPIMQVVQMSSAPPTTANQEAQQITQLQNLGFESHRLPDGGAMWMSFYEQEEHEASWW